MESVLERYPWRTWLVWVAAVFAVVQFIDALFISVPFAGIVFAVLVGILAWWTYRAASWVPVALLLLLSTLELLMVLFVYPNSPEAPAAWRLAIFAVLATAVTALSVLDLLRGARSR